MILSLIKQVVKGMLHQASDEWAVEIGLSEEAVADARAKRVMREAQREAEADERAAAALGVHEEEILSLPVLTMHSAAQVTTEANQESKPVAAQSCDSSDSKASQPSAEESNEQPSLLNLPATASQVANPDDCPHPSAGEDALLDWVRRRREENLAWADITCQAKKAGHLVGDGALKKRFRMKQASLGQTM